MDREGGVQPLGVARAHPELLPERGLRRGQVLEERGQRHARHALLGTGFELVLHAPEVRRLDLEHEGGALTAFGARLQLHGAERELFGESVRREAEKRKHNERSFHASVSRTAASCTYSAVRRRAVTYSPATIGAWPPNRRSPACRTG